MVIFFHESSPLGALPRPQPPQMVRGLLWCWGGVQAGRLATRSRSARVRTAPRHGEQRPHHQPLCRSPPSLPRGVGSARWGLCRYISGAGGASAMFHVEHGCLCNYRFAGFRNSLIFNYRFAGFRNSCLCNGCSCGL